ncbi:MAG TPA: hotdog fold domain-containing protein [Dehalococcoidia bacterium]|nr:hotdog fold domain-containing protein [Dehalococcoidia bacterium]
MVSEPADSPRRWCFGCGDENPQGLHIQFSIEDGAAVGRFVTVHAHQGYPGVAHGGVAAAALDEAMGWAMYAAGAWAMTARMEVRFRRPVPLGDTLTVRAQVSRDRGRWLEARGDIRSEGGQVLAEARALFMRLPADRARQMQEFYVGRAGEPAGE